MQIGIVKLHARLTALHGLNGLATSVWSRASKARIGMTLASQKATGVVVLGQEGLGLSPTACGGFLSALPSNATPPQTDI